MSQEIKKGKRKQVAKEKVIHKDENEENAKKNSNESVKLKYGPSLTFPYQRIWSRSALILAVLFIVWYNSKYGKHGKEIYLARQKEILLSRTQHVECTKEYKDDISKYPECAPEKCGRIVADKLVSSTETDVLLKMAINGFSLGGADDGESILDLHSGALTKGHDFISNVYAQPDARKIFNSADFAIYKVIRTKIQHAVAYNFGVHANNIHLTQPTFFSRMTNISAKTINDEYWHPQADKDTYKSFHYTTLLYLNDYGRDFEGGRLLFIDKNTANTVVEPRKGRVAMYTSGSENVYAVEKVQSGTRYSLTVSFTCDPNAAIPDPKLLLKQEK